MESERREGWSWGKKQVKEAAKTKRKSIETKQRSKEGKTKPNGLLGEKVLRKGALEGGIGKVKK